MTNNTRKTVRRATATGSREEAAAITDTDAAAVQTFLSAAQSRRDGFHAEARDYVAAIDARGGKRGSAAAVQSAIAKALTAAGLGSHVLSATRYSKLAESWRAVPAAGLSQDSAEHFGVLYELWNVPSAKDAKPGALTVAQRSEIVAAAKRRRSPDAAVEYIRKAIADAKRKSPTVPPAAPKGTEPEGKGSESGAPTAPTVPTDAESVLDAIADLFAVAATLTDADRIRIATAFRESADTLTASVVPSDVSALTDAA